MNKYNNFPYIVKNDIPDENVQKAYEMTLIEYSKDSIMRILADNNDEIKLMPIINLNSIDNVEELNIVLAHLTGKDGRIREAISYVLSKNPDCTKFINNENQNKIIVDGLLDINPNVARNIIDFIENSGSYKQKIAPMIIKKTNEILEKLSKFIRYDLKHKENKEKSQKNHAKNKLTFNLYWLLSAISVLNVDNLDNLEEILTKTSSFLDYTIREKTALILSKMENPPKKLLQKLQQDENIYVKNQLLC